MSNAEIEQITRIIASTDTVARIRERIAILEILEEELNHVSSQLELDLIDRIKGAINHRHKEGLK